MVSFSKLPVDKLTAITKPFQNQMETDFEAAMEARARNLAQEVAKTQKIIERIFNASVVLESLQFAPDPDLYVKGFKRLQTEIL